MPTNEQRNLARSQAAVTRTIQALPGRRPGPSLHATVPPMPYSRDRHRAGVYGAESDFGRLTRNHAAAPSALIENIWVRVPSQRTFDDLPTVQQYVDQVTIARGASRISVRASDQLSTQAMYKGGVITLPLGGDDHRWAWTEATVLHEVTHHLLEGYGHNPPFPRTLAELVTEWISPDAGKLLVLLYVLAGVTI